MLEVADETLSLWETLGRSLSQLENRSPSPGLEPSRCLRLVALGKAPTHEACSVSEDFIPHPRVVRPELGAIEISLGLQANEISNDVLRPPQLIREPFTVLAQFGQRRLDALAQLSQDHSLKWGNRALEVLVSLLFGQSVEPNSRLRLADELFGPGAGPQTEDALNVCRLPGVSLGCGAWLPE